MIKPRKAFRGMVKRAAKRNKRASKVPSISKLIQACDKAFSARVRRILAGTIVDVNFCFTCGKMYEVKKLHCGHYLSRYYKAARWNYDNARPQCMMCNLWRKGDPIVFRRNLIKEIGEARVLAVEALRDAPIKLTREYLTELLTSLTA